MTFEKKAIITLAALVVLLLVGFLCVALAAVPEPELPSKDIFWISVVDFDGATVVGRVQIDENASKLDRKALRTKVETSVRSLGNHPYVKRPDIANFRGEVVLPGDDNTPDAGVVCKCSKLECQDPTVCGLACNGPCDDCFVCRLVNPGSPVKNRPRK